MTLGVVAVIIGLLAVNAFYVAAEFGAVSARRSRIRELAEAGNRLAAGLLPAVEDSRRLDRYISACQLGITLSSLGLGAYGQATLARSLRAGLGTWGGLGQGAAESVAATVVLLGLSALQVVLAELVPKALALQYPTQAALYTVLPMRWSLALFSGLIAVLNAGSLLLLRSFGVQPVGQRHIHSPEEIDLLIAESRTGGLLDAEEEQRLHRAIRLSARPVHQLMVPRPYIEGIALDSPPEQVLSTLARSPYTRLPVYEGSIDNVVGMLHLKDVLEAHLTRGPRFSLRNLLRPLPAVPEMATADRLLGLFRSRRTHQAIVTDEYGGVAGLVTLEDVLAEVIGEVPDEMKRQQPRPTRLPDGRVRLAGLMRPEDAEPWVGRLWTGEADTIGGLVTEALGRLPAAGDRLELAGVPVEVETVRRHAVVSLLATPLPPPAEEEP